MFLIRHTACAELSWPYGIKSATGCCTFHKVASLKEQKLVQQEMKGVLVIAFFHEMR